MQIKRLSGLGGNLLTNNTLNNVELEGSNLDSPGFGYMYINDSQVTTVNSNTGMFVVVMNENLQILETRRFLLTSNAPTGQRDSDFINFIGSLPLRRYYALVSNNQIGTSSILDTFFNEVLNSSSWNDMWTLYNTAYSSPQTLGRLSYSAFGSTDLGITHESYGIGNYKATLSIGIHEYDYFMNTGYGKPLYTISKQTLGPTYSSYTIPASTVNSNGVYFTMRYRNSLDVDDIRIEKVYNDSSVETYDLTSAGIDLYTTTNLRLSNDSTVSEYIVSIKNIDLLFLDMYRSSPNSIINPVSSISKKGQGMSVSSIMFSMNGYDFENPSHLTNFSNLNKVYTCSNTRNVNNIPMDSFTINGTQESDFIPVDYQRDYFISFFGMNNTASPTNGTVSIKTYDSSYNLTSSVSLTSLTSSQVHNMGNFENSSQDIFYQEYYVLSSKQSTSDVTNASYLTSDVYGNVDSGGWSSESNNVNDIIIMNDGVSYITIELYTDDSVEIINPVCDIVKFALTKDSKYLGTIDES